MTERVEWRLYPTRGRLETTRLQADTHRAIEQSARPREHARDASSVPVSSSNPENPTMYLANAIAMSVLGGFARGASKFIPCINSWKQKLNFCLRRR